MHFLVLSRLREPSIGDQIQIIFLNFMALLKNIPYFYMSLKYYIKP
jgi:hypothetical protein